MIQDTVYVTGHQHPDTDSIAAAIGYAFYKRAHGVRAVPCRLGKLSMETKFLLKRFGFEQPMFLDDARVRLSEIQIDAPIAISPDTTILEARNIIRETGKKTLGVVDENGKLIGLVTKCLQLKSSGYCTVTQRINEKAPKKSKKILLKPIAK